MSSNVGSCAVALACNFVPDTHKPSGKNFSQAANLWQANIIREFYRLSGQPICVFSQQPFASFPTERLIWVKGERVVSLQECSVTHIPFLNLPVVRYFGVGLVVFFLMLRWAFAHRLERRIMIAYNGGDPPLWATWLAARLSGSRCAIIINDIPVSGHTVAKKSSLWHTFLLNTLKWYVPRFDRLITITEQVAAWVAPGKPFHVCVGGIVPVTKSEAIPSSIERVCNSSCFKVVAAGSLYEYNGFLKMIEAMCRIASSGIEYFIAGPGPLEADVRRASARDSRLIYLGSISPSEVAQLYAHSDLLVNLRLTDLVDDRFAFSSKLLEMLGSGVPVVTTNVGSFLNSFHDEIFLVEGDPVAGLATQIERAMRLGSDVRTQMGLRAKEKMINSYSWEKQARAIWEFVTD